MSKPSKNAGDAAGSNDAKSSADFGGSRDGNETVGSSVESSSAESFYGNYEHSLDSKGRVALPAGFRSLLGVEDNNSVVLTNFITDGVRCLDGFGLRAWKDFEAKLRSRGRFNPSVRQLETFYIARAQICTCDSNGRINIPPHLREYAGIEKEAVFTASLHGFRIWRKEVWNLVFRQAEEMLLENPALFEGVDA